MSNKMEEILLVALDRDESTAALFNLGLQLASKLALRSVLLPFVCFFVSLTVNY